MSDLALALVYVGWATVFLSVAGWFYVVRQADELLVACLAVIGLFPPLLAVILPVAVAGLIGERLTRAREARIHQRGVVARAIAELDEDLLRGGPR